MEKRIHPYDLNSESPIGLKLPLGQNTINIFALNYTTLDQSKTNIRNLLLTSKGERAYLPDYGCDIRKVLFEQNYSLTARVDEVIRTAFKKWLPYILINQLDVSTLQENEHLVYIKIQFSLSHDPETYEEITIPIMVS